MGLQGVREDEQHFSYPLATPDSNNLLPTIKPLQTPAVKCLDHIGDDLPEFPLLCPQPSAYDR